MGAVVAFEVDEVDPVQRTGWSVMVVGRASIVEHPDDLELARALPLDPWALEGGDHFVRIRTHRITGREVVPIPADDVLSAIL